MVLVKEPLRNSLISCIYTINQHRLLVYLSTSLSHASRRKGDITELVIRGMAGCFFICSRTKMGVTKAFNFTLQIHFNYLNGIVTMDMYD